MYHLASGIYTFKRQTTKKYLVKKNIIYKYTNLRNYIIKFKIKLLLNYA